MKKSARPTKKKTKVNKRSLQNTLPRIGGVAISGRRSKVATGFVTRRFFFEKK